MKFINNSANIKKYINENRLSNDIDTNISIIKEVFSKNDNLICREFSGGRGGNIRCCAFFFDGMVNGQSIHFHIIKPIQQMDSLPKNASLFEHIKNEVISIGEMSEQADISEMARGVMIGDTLLLINGCSKALVLNSKGYLLRPVMEPTSEYILSGPREGFNENVMANLSLIRRKVANEKLKFESINLGEVTKTAAFICYIEGIVNEEVLKRLKEKLSSFDYDSILDTNYLKEHLKKNRFSPFETTGSTERPDVVAAKILEGRVAVIVDGTPVVLTVPHLFLEPFQSNEDYYTNYYYGSLSRIIRVICFMISISLPALFLSLATFNQELLPQTMLQAFAASRQNVTFPTVIEIIALLFIFNALREGGMRMPSGSGQAFSIVGALVLGQAAIDARIVGPITVVVIAFTGISDIMLYKLTSSSTVVRTFLIILSLLLGFYGFVMGLTAVLLHLYSLDSLGVPYMSNVVVFSKQGIKDTIIRAPLWDMITRPFFLSKNRIRKGKK